MNKNGLIIIIIAVLVLGGGAYALRNKSDKKNTPAASSQTSNTPATDTTATSPTDQLAAATITYKDGSFSPSTVTIKSGQSVNIINNSATSVDFESDPHPTHTDNAELNVGSIAAGSNKTITIVKTGSWGYHNHLNPGETGKIIVQ